MRKRSVFILVCLINTLAFSQEENAQIEQQIELISQRFEDENIDLTALVEVLYYRLEHPLNLNRCSREELEELLLLNPLQIKEFLLHRQENGKLLSLLELQGLNSFSLETIDNIKPFVVVLDQIENPHIGAREAIKYSEFEWISRFQKGFQAKQGYQNGESSYMGNPDKYYSRLRWKYKTNFSMGVTMEKDPGEELSSAKRPDFVSAHLYYQGGHYLRSFSLGDYQVQIGQGLNMFMGYSMGKTGAMALLCKNSRAINPYRSLDENRFLRGTATVVGMGKWELLTFYSKKKRDASLTFDSLIGNMVATSISNSGFHRTNSEINGKNSMEESILGTNLSYSSSNLEIGFSALHQSYDIPVQPAYKVYNQFDFTGTTSINLGVDYTFSHQNFSVFGESVMDKLRNSYAHLHGVIWAADPRMSFSVLYRNYDKDYHSFYASAIGEGSTVQNEKGLLLGSEIKLHKHWDLQLYADFYSHPWLKFLVNAPSQGQEYFAQLDFKPNKKTHLYFRYSSEDKQKNARLEDADIVPLEWVEKKNFRIQYSFKVSESITLRNRVEHVQVNRPSNDPEQGVLLYQDLLFRPKSFPVDLTFRYAIFETDSYDSRIYSYENQVLNVFSVPAYYYQGNKVILMARYKWRKRIDFWLRFSRVVYTNQETISSGYEEIKGNVKSDISLQLRFRF
ncbi:MAG: hypothetical protein ACI9XP_000920 [Lentimonas sp.]|jgi:hypothetical protein